MKFIRRLCILIIGLCALISAVILVSRVAFAPKPPLCAHCNVIVIVVGSLSYDNTSLANPSLDTTPFLEELAKVRAVSFTHAYVQAPWSIPSYGSLMTGLYPSDLSLWKGTDALPKSARTIAEDFKGAGYTTALFSSGLIRPEFGFSKGFETVEGSLTGTSVHDMTRMFKASELWIQNAAKGGAPFFLFLSPYDLHEISPAEKNSTALKDRYDATVRSTDERLSNFFGVLEASGVAKNTVVVITSSNGEEFGEHALVGEHSSSLYDESIRVPLLFVMPNKSGTTIDGSVELRSLPSTLLEITGIDNTVSSRGSSLLPYFTGTETDNRIVLTTTAITQDELLSGAKKDSDMLAQISTGKVEPRERTSSYTGPRRASAIQGTLKTIRNGDGTLEMYDLAVDPHETNNVYPLLPSLPYNERSVLFNLSLLTSRL